jgi:hypothetical protein
MPTFILVVVAVLAIVAAHFRRLLAVVVYVATNCECEPRRAPPSVDTSHLNAAPQTGPDTPTLKAA